MSRGLDVEASGALRTYDAQAGLRVQGFRFGVYGLGLQGLGPWVQSLGFFFWSLGFRASGLEGLGVEGGVQG